MRSDLLLEIKNLRTYFHTDQGVSKAVDGVDIFLYPGETLGVVGESGCGKSVTFFSVLRLIQPPGKIVGGEITYKGQDLLKLSDKEMRKIRGNEISMIFQEPMVSLNPVYTIGQQIMEVILQHQKTTKKEALAKSIDMLHKVGIPFPERRVHEYPHQLSGGMRQRAMIAMALCCEPDVLIADEPTTALDVTTQAQILDLMLDLKAKYNTAIIMVTHNLGIVAQMCDKVAVMYAGQVVEYASVEELFVNPLHPYTYSLMNSIPRIDVDIDRLKTIPGVVPSPLDRPSGCRFYPRCSFADTLCKNEAPSMILEGENHMVRCWYYKQLMDKEQQVKTQSK